MLMPPAMALVFSTASRILAGTYHVSFVFMISWLFCCFQEGAKIRERKISPRGMCLLLHHCLICDVEIIIITSDPLFIV